MAGSGAGNGRCLRRRDASTRHATSRTARSEELVARGELLPDHARDRDHREAAVVELLGLHLLEARLSGGLEADSLEQLGRRFCKALRFDDAHILEANGIAGVEWAASQTEGDDRAVKAAAQICEAYRSEKMLADEPFDLQIMSAPRLRGTRRQDA